MATNKAGKYTKLTDETIKKLEEVFAIDGTIEEACFYADIRTQTYYNWIKEKPELKVRFDELRNRPVLKARQEVMKGLNCYSNAMDYLKRKKALEFGDRLVVDNNIKINEEDKAKANDAIGNYLNDSKDSTRE